MNGVRSGIVAFYLCFILFYWKKISIGKVAIFLSSTLLISLLIFPHFKIKVQNTIASISQVLNKTEITNESDFGRFDSISGALKAIESNQLSGVGLGDIKKEMEHRTKYKFSLLPHNQFVFIFLMSGVIGLLIFTFCLAKIISIILKLTQFLLS